MKITRKAQKIGTLWSAIQSEKSQTKIIKELEDGFIPVWLARDCFEYAWRMLKMKEEREIGV